MGGGVNPIEWVVPPVALTHTIVDQGASISGKPIPGAPGSQSAEATSAQDEALSAKIKAQNQAIAQQTQQERDLAARTETPLEAEEARRRAGAASERLGGGKRRASQTLTTPGQTLSGSYP